MMSHGPANAGHYVQPSTIRTRHESRAGLVHRAIRRRLAARRRRMGEVYHLARFLGLRRRPDRQLVHPWTMGRKRPGPSQPTVAGDIVVTRVSGHYHISRAQDAGKSFVQIEVMNRREDAIARACELATGRQRVFMYGKSGSADCIEIDCSKPPPTPLF